MEDWSCSPIAVWPCSRTRDNPRVPHCFIQVNGSPRFSQAPQLWGTSWHPACRVKADSGRCHHHQLQPGLAVYALWDLPFSEQPRSTGRRWKVGELSLPMVSFVSVLDPSSTPCCNWSRTEGSKPTRIKVTSHWSQAKVWPCTLAPQLSYWLVLRIPGISCIKKCIFSGCLEKYSNVCFSSSWGCSKFSCRQRPCLFLNSLSHSREKPKPCSCGHSWGSTYTLEGPIPLVSWLMP